MNNKIRHIAFYPLSLLYGIVTGVRNWLFDQEILKITTFQIPVICVGNLSVGGTGKTPHTELIIRSLHDEWQTVMLSRGYKRVTKGLHLADESSTSQTIGDEPYQIFKKFPNIKVAVDEKRVHGVKKLIQTFPGLQLVVLDDAYQHRHIHAGLSILLTDFSNLYSHDLMLPAGTLREWKSGSKRADIIVVTKCPVDLKPIDMRIIETEIKPETNQLLFFSTYVYDELISVFPAFETQSWTFEKINETKPDVLLIAGIVSPEPILEQIKKYTNEIESLFFEDHHTFQSKDYSLIKSKFDALKSEAKIIIITEKDASRIVSDPNFPESLKSRTFAMPIRVEILNKQETLFIQKIKNYVVENSRNG